MPHRLRSYPIIVLLVLSLLVNGGNLRSQADSGDEPIGPQLLKDFSIGTESTEPYGLFPFGDLLLFSPNNNDFDYEPWVTDGTLEGTRLLKDINPDWGSAPSFLLENNGFVYFSAYNITTGQELWKTDGTPDGTEFVADLAEGALSSRPHALVGSGLNIYFIASPSGSSSDNRLYRSDGTQSGTVRITDMPLRANVLSVFQGQVYFLASASGNDTGLWRTAGSGIELVKQTCASGCAGSWTPSNENYGFAILNNELYFGAYGPDGMELWKTDGSEAGTFLVNQFGMISDSVDYFTVSGNWLYFSGYQSATGRDLWRTDGTNANTQIIADCSEDFSAGPQALTSVNEDLYFKIPTINDGSHLLRGTLWKWDSVSEQALKIMDSYLHPPESLVEMNDRLYFTASPNYSGKTELLYTEGTTNAITSLNIGADELAHWKGGLAFNSENDLYGSELWFSDGTETGTQVLFDLNKAPQGSDFRPAISYQEKLIIGFDDELWISDGNPLGTEKLANVGLSYEPYYVDSGPEKFNYYPSQELNGILYFRGYEPDHGWELWRTDGTPQGTWLAADVTPGPDYSDFAILAQAGEYIYFSVHSIEAGCDHIWRSDGTPEGTQVMDLTYTCEDFQGMSVLDDAVLIVYGNYLYKSTPNGDLERVSEFDTRDTPLYVTYPLDGYLYFSGGPDSMDGLLFQTDGTSIHQIFIEGGWLVAGVDDFIGLGNRLLISGRFGGVPGLGQLIPGSTYAEVIKAFNSSDRLIKFTVLNDNLLFFQVQGESNNDAIWVSDGTEAGTRELCPSCGFLVSGDFMAAWQGQMYFSATDEAHGDELWVTDGTEAGTHLFADIVPGPASSNPQYLDSNENALFFSANDGIHGAEPWSVYLGAQTNIYLPLITH